MNQNIARTSKLEPHYGLQIWEAQGGQATQSNPDGIKHGDILYVDTQDRIPRPGNIYVFFINNNGYYAKCSAFKGEKQLWLMVSVDNRYKEALKVEEVDIIGRVKRTQSSREFKRH